jgi:hypothetical protein
LGRQWVFGEKLLLDAYFVLGYGIENKERDSYYYDDGSAFNYINSRGVRSPGFSGTWGLKLGLLLDDKREMPIKKINQTKSRLHQAAFCLWVKCTISNLG